MNSNCKTSAPSLGAALSNGLLLGALSLVVGCDVDDNSGGFMESFDQARGGGKREGNRGGREGRKNDAGNDDFGPARTTTKEEGQQGGIPDSRRPFKFQAMIH